MKNLKITILSISCGFTLLASGNVGAPPSLFPMYSVGNEDFSNANLWDDTATACPGVSAPGTIPTSSHIANICSGHTVTLTAPVTVNSVTVNGTLTLSSTLTTVATSGITLTSSGTLTVNAGGAINGNLTTYGLAIGGSLRFTAGNKTITNFSATSVIPTLDVSLMNTGDTITVSGPGTLDFASITGGSLTCGGTPYYNGYGISGSCTVTVTPAPPPPISAPIDFSFNHKPVEIFTTEIQAKHGM